MFVIDNVGMEQQVRNLNCGRFCLEALMLWRHGNRFGRPTVGNPVQSNEGGGRSLWWSNYGVARTTHSQAALTHINNPFAIAFRPENYHAEYGLFALPAPTTAAGWEVMLKAYGPIIISGPIGAVEFMEKLGAGHYVLVIGIDDANDQLIYLDPLGDVVSGGLSFLFGSASRDSSEQKRYDRTQLQGRISNSRVLLALLPMN